MELEKLPEVKLQPGLFLGCSRPFQTPGSAEHRGGCKKKQVFLCLGESSYYGF